MKSGSHVSDKVLDESWAKRGIRLSNAQSLLMTFLGAE
jgi:hypothetical protein